MGGRVDGVLQEYRVFKTGILLPIPKHLSYEEGSTLPATGSTVWSALFGATPLVPGETMLLQGTGGVSMTGLMVASAAGAKVGFPVRHIYLDDLIRTTLLLYRAISLP